MYAYAEGFDLNEVADALYQRFVSFIKSRNWAWTAICQTWLDFVRLLGWEK